MTMRVAAVLALLSCGPLGADLLDDELVQRTYEEAVAALAKGADIVLPEPVPVVLLTAEEAAERRAEYARQLDENVGMTTAIDSMADLMFSESMLGRYLPDEKVVYIIEDVLLASAGYDDDELMEELFGVMAHELVHAYDDQVYGVLPAPADLEELFDDPSAIVEVQTLMSLLEGRATYAAELACEAAGRRAFARPTVEEARAARLIESDGSFGGDVLAGLGNSVARIKLLQYAQGCAFAEQAFRYGGEAFFRHVFDHLPLSLDELEDFGRFRVRWAEELEARLELEEGP